MRVVWRSLCDKLQKSGGRGTKWVGKESAKEREVRDRSRRVETPGGKGKAEGGEGSQMWDGER